MSPRASSAAMSRGASSEGVSGAGTPAGPSVEKQRSAAFSAERNWDSEVSGGFSAERRSAGTPGAAPARLLSASTAAGPSASTPVPGRMWSAVPLVSPFLPGAGGVSIGASLELTGPAATAGRRQTGSLGDSGDAAVPPSAGGASPTEPLSPPLEDRREASPPPPLSPATVHESPRPSRHGLSSRSCPSRATLR